jgi:hydrogenase maturation protein HypF
MPSPLIVDAQSQEPLTGERTRLRIRVRGLVQGVGYRPFFYKLAVTALLGGWIGNDSEGVLAEVEGEPQRVQELIARLKTEQPPLARVDEVSCESIAPRMENDFFIHTSIHGGSAHTGIPADAATCADCRHELLDPSDRRFRYPFLNCTNCGPRFTITRKVPYDRQHTSMAPFTMCPACQREYDDPANRRFHAQPNACPKCGPKLEFVENSALPTQDVQAESHRQQAIASDTLQETIHRLGQGQIIAIKGVGGFHLAVDAGNEQAVQRLRQRKHRAAKPFAIMVNDLAAARALCEISDAEIQLLTGPQAPVVLLRRRFRPEDINSSKAAIAPSVAPGIPWLGIFLPYAPLHHLLFATGELSALVMTSANLSDEPICIDNTEAQQRLAVIADGFLMHNREILQRCDDSVFAVVERTPQVIRRARGFVPLPVSLPVDAPPLLAVGGEMKNVFTLARGREAYQSQHLGDLRDRSSLEFFESALTHMKSTFEIEPEYVVHDLHPDYLSTQWASDYARAHSLPLIGVQHHHAHIASCMAEHGLQERVIGIALDGTGYGTDGTVWGGEVMTASLTGFDRVAHLRPIPMPGGDRAVEQPWRMALSAIVTCLGEEAARSAAFPAPDAPLLLQWLLRGRVAPVTSSCGRLFDAVAALVLGRHSVDYEAQAAIELEGVASEDDCGAYQVEISDGPSALLIEPRKMLRQVLSDLSAKVPASQISARFHSWLAVSFAGAAERIRLREQSMNPAHATLTTVCLSGGCMHNRLLTRLLRRELEARGFRVLLQTKVSPGDGGLSYGQAAVAASRIAQRSVDLCAMQ